MLPIQRNAISATSLRAELGTAQSSQQAAPTPPAAASTPAAAPDSQQASPGPPAAGSTSAAASDSYVSALRNPFGAASSLANTAAPTAGADSQDQLLGATKPMQESQMSFNLQYLQLQSQMQDENRSYNAVSNIMKTKHATVKNSLPHIR